MPLSLIGTFGVMYLRRLQPQQPVAHGAHHLDRLRRRRRHRHDREHRALHRGGRAARSRRRSKGAEQIGFTIVSLTVSLVAVLIPLLFMGGLIGRLFREFAVTLARVDRRLGGAVAHADADDVRAPAAARAASRSERGALYRWSERAFEGVIAFYDRGLQVWSSRHQLHDARSSPSPRVALTVRPGRRSCPRASSRSRTRALILGVTEAPPDVSFPQDDGAPASRWPTSSLADPDVAQRRLVHRLRRHEPDDQQRAAVDHAQAARRAHGERRRDHRPPAAEARAGRRASTLYLQSVQDLQIDSRVSRTQFQYTLRGRRPGGARRVGAARWSTELRKEPRLQATSPATRRAAGLQVSLDDRPRHRLAPRHLAAGDRRHALRRLRAAPGLDHLHAAQSLPRHPRGEARAWRASAQALDRGLYVRTADRRAGAARARSCT